MEPLLSTLILQMTAAEEDTLSWETPTQQNFTPTVSHAIHKITNFHAQFKIRKTKNLKFNVRKE